VLRELEGTQREVTEWYVHAREVQVYCCGIGRTSQEAAYTSVRQELSKAILCDDDVV